MRWIVAIVVAAVLVVSRIQLSPAGRGPARYNTPHRRRKPLWAFGQASLAVPGVGSKFAALRDEEVASVAPAWNAADRSAITALGGNGLVDDVQLTCVRGRCERR